MAIRAEPFQITSGKAPDQRDDKTPPMSRNRLAWIMIAVAAIITSTAFLGVVLPALSGPSFHTEPVEEISISDIFFNITADQVTFQLQNSGTRSVTIVQVQVSGGNSGGNIPPGTSTTQISGNIIPPSSAIYLTATFAGVTLQPQTTYQFVLISARGSRFLYTAMS